MGWLFIVWVVVVVIAIAIFRLYLEDQQLKRLRQIARRHGLHFHIEDPFDIPSRYPFELFKQGHSQKASNCLSGKYRDLHVVLFDYSYRTGSGSDETTHTLSALMAKLDIYSPHLIIRPETMLHRFAAFFGFEDIKFESDEFNRAFNVRADDKKFAYDICHAEMMEFLLQHPSMCWELGGAYLLLYEPGTQTSDPHELRKYLNLASDFAARIPEYLRKEFRP
jgi:hypothetical protein